MGDLGPFLRDSTAKRRQAGAWDCCTFPAAWAIEAGERDPMAAWRGEYDSEADAEFLIADAGGLDALFAQGMAAAGIREIDAAGPFEPGDIGVVKLLEQEAGAVFAGKRWAFVADRGLAFVSLDADCIVRAWRPGHG